jgi:predicted dehydrogenase
VLAAARACAGKVHAVMQNRRWLPQIIRLRDSLRAGAIGELTEIHADFFLDAHFPGFREQMLPVLLIDMAIHHFDMARFISGADPVAVNALEWNPRGSWFRHGACVLMCAEMANGVRLTYRGSWVAQGATTPWEASWRVIGTGGTALWDGAESVMLHRMEAPQPGEKHATMRPAEPAPPAPKLAHEAHGGCIDDMIAAVRGGRPAATRGEDNVLSLAMVHAAIRSADRQGARVAIAEVLGEVPKAVQGAGAR